MPDASFCRLYKEDSFDGTNIYPQRVGVVSSVVVTPEGNYDIVDKDNNVDYSQYRIAGEKATITFQTGRLAGRTFDIAQDKDVLKYDHATKRFQLVSVEEDGMKLPEPKVFYPAVGDKYAVFGVRLPDEYITKAETELLNASVRYFHEALQPKVTYKAELDGLYAQKNWGALAPKLAIGAYVRLVDTSLDIDDHVRITAIRTKLSQQYKPQITLSNEVQAPSLAVSLGTLEAEGVQQKEEVQAVRREVARSYQQAMSLADGIADEVRAGFGDSISPVTARTMQLMVGDKSLQFVFVASPTATGSVTHNVTWDESRGILHADSGYLRHMTLGINTLSADHKPSEYKTWTLPAYDYAVRTDQKTIHLYAKVERNGANGVFFATDTAKAMEAEAGYYYLYLGMLSQAPNRAFTPLYGFTEVLPSQIRTERITSADGRTSINLNTGEIVSDKIKFRHPDGGEKSYPSDYLHEAIKEGSTEIQGGLVLGSIIGAKNNAGAVASYLSGVANLPAFAAGVTHFGKPNEARVVAINHDGTGHWGQMEVMEGGKVVQIGSMRFGGKLPNTYTQDLRTLEFNDPRHERSRTYIGDDGALFFFGMWGATPRFVRISNQLNKPVVQIRGDVDISGSLLGGRVYAGDVSFEHKWGARADRMSIRRKETGIYIVTHDLGHTRYSVLCMDAGNGRHNAKAGKITANSFEIYTKYDNTLYSDIDFTFLVFGDNY